MSTPRKRAKSSHNHYLRSVSAPQDAETTATAAKRTTPRDPRGQKEVHFDSSAPIDAHDTDPTVLARDTPASQPTSPARSPRAPSTTASRDGLPAYDLLHQSIPSVSFIFYAIKISEPGVEMLLSLLRKAISRGPQHAAVEDNAAVETIRAHADIARFSHAQEEYWFHNVALRLFELAAKDQGFEALTVQTCHLAKAYLPTLSAVKFQIDKRIDAVLKFSESSFKKLYALMHDREKRTYMSPFNALPNSGYIVGTGIEVKASSGGSLKDAEAQIAIWCISYFKWLHALSGHSVEAKLSPIFACVIVGATFELYIAYPVKRSASQEFDVHLWGPHPDLRSDLDTTEGIKRAVSLLRAVMKHLRETMMKQIRDLLALVHDSTA